MATMESEEVEEVELTFIIGSLGSWDPLNRDTLKALQIGNKYARLFRKLCVSDAIKGSYMIWKSRSTEPIDRFKNKHYFFISYTFFLHLVTFLFAQLTFRFVLSLIPGIGRGVLCWRQPSVFTVHTLSFQT